MTMQTVTASFQTTASYWLQPQYALSTASGIQDGPIISGILYGSSTSAASFTVQMDDTFKWNIRITGQNMPIVYFIGLSVAGGGNLFALLTAQGWTPPA